MKRTARDSSSLNTKGEVSIKVVKGETGGTDVEERGLERMFDPTWLAPIEVLNRLDELRYIHRDIKSTPIGGLFLCAATMSVIDIRMLKEMWPYLSDMFVQQEISKHAWTPKTKQKAVAELKKNYEHITQVLQKLPHAIQASFLTPEGAFWSTLRADSMLINPDDLALKHGSEIAGEWFLLGIMDAQPGTVRYAEESERSDLGSAMAQILNALRESMGRPNSAYGVTPIAIFRAPPIPKEFE